LHSAVAALFVAEFARAVFLHAHYGLAEHADAFAFAGQVLGHFPQPVPSQPAPGHLERTVPAPPVRAHLGRPPKPEIA
jgi:hypothetical protein